MYDLEHCPRCREVPVRICSVVSHLYRFQSRACKENACQCLGGLRVWYPDHPRDYCPKHAQVGRATSFETTRKELLKLLVEATRYTWYLSQQEQGARRGLLGWFCSDARRSRKRRRVMLHAIAQLRSCTPGRKVPVRSFRVPLDLFLECRAWSLAACYRNI